ncbi:hypothetical protein BKA66DRAFT_118015 [Pyrenochaeta sp. MPI-SDFR-AT-0127]|nr:hypothetical protein BKA66DRAFT_118015 [Pyrenochaeta sp. MPI-SDFR-AT-0127]
MFSTTSIKEYSLARQRHDFQDATPPPLIINPLLHRHSESQYSQKTSILLSRLPLEIRLYIWSHALGNQRVHIISKYRRLGHTLCDTEYWREWEAERPGLRASSWMYTYGSLPTTKKLADYNLCDLLVSCKQIYAEACPLLYKTNVFTFFDLRTVAIFRCSIPPKRWNAIRYMDVYAMFYRKDDVKDSVETQSQLQLEAWPNVCAAFASMLDLRSLRILIGNARYLDAGYLLGGRRMELYEVILRFLGRCKMNVGIDVVLMSETDGYRHRKRTWDLLGLEEMA